MRLISLYIENFGKLSNYSYDFSSKMNSIYEENGWGKTTLTVFVKAMLYGLNNKNERIKYTPWDKKDYFGGTLKIEVNKKRYIIDRRFSSKKASLDEFHIYDLKTNLEIKDLKSNLGESFLNLNETSFERSVFIPEKELDEGFGSDIEAKLANLIGGTNDSQSYEEAMNILESKARELRLNSKKGLILDKKKELASVESDILEYENKLNAISDLQGQIATINSEINGLNDVKKETNNKIIIQSKEQDKLAKLQVLNTYKEDIAETKKRLDDNNQIFNGKNVTVDEVLRIRAVNKELINLKTEFEIKKQENSSYYNLDEMKTQFGFKDGIPSEEEIENINRKVQKYTTIKGVINAHNEVPERKKPIMAIVTLIISLVVIAVGAILLTTGLVGFSGTPTGDALTITAFIILIVGVLGTIASLGMFVANYMKNQNVNYGRVKNYDFELKELEENIREFFGKFHLYSSDYSNSLYIVKNNSQRYNEALLEAKKFKDRNQSLENKIKENEEKVLDFISQFNTTALTVEEKIGELNTHLRRKAEIENLIIQKETACNQFIIVNDLNNINNQMYDVDELNRIIEDIEEKISNLNKEIALKSSKIAEFEAESNRLDDLYYKKDILEQEIKKLENEYQMLIYACDFLKKSQTSLLEKYVKPMKDSVDKYVNLFLKNNNEYNIDVNFKFKFITNQGLKGLDLYSRGYQTIIALCMRLALIDCLYPTEKPFVIFDDPFVNFDDEKLELSKRLMLEIAEHYQIVYFTCHESRVIR